MADHTFTIEIQREIGTIRLGGRVTGARVEEALRGLYEHADWQPGYGALLDLRDLAVLDITPHDAERLIALMRTLEPRMGQGRAAVVVSETVGEVIAKLILLRTMNPARERRVFFSLEEALAWLRPDGPAAG